MASLGSIICDDILGHITKHLEVRIHTIVWEHMTRASCHSTLSRSVRARISLVQQSAQPIDVARLGAVGREFHKVAVDDATAFWSTAYLLRFQRPHQRGAADEHLSVYQLFSRKLTRHLYRRTPLGVELTLPRGVPVPVSVSRVPPLDEQVHDYAVVRHRSRSRGGSLDLPLPEQKAVYDTVESGALRFVHLSRSRIALGASDNGHAAAWMVPPALRRGAVAAPLQPSTLCDTFAHAVNAKARRDAKRKYASRARQESRLVFFKINSLGRESKLGMQGGAVIPGIAAGAVQQLVGGLDLWGDSSELGAGPLRRVHDSMVMQTAIPQGHITSSKTATPKGEQHECEELQLSGSVPAKSPLQRGSDDSGEASNTLLPGSKFADRSSDKAVQCAPTVADAHQFGPISSCTGSDVGDEDDTVSTTSGDNTVTDGAAVSSRPHPLDEWDDVNRDIRSSAWSARVGRPGTVPVGADGVDGGSAVTSRRRMKKHLHADNTRRAPPTLNGHIREPSLQTDASQRGHIENQVDVGWASGGSGSGGGSDVERPKARGRQAWSEADRKRWDERQQRRSDRKAARAAAVHSPPLPETPGASVDRGADGDVRKDGSAPLRLQLIPDVQARSPPTGAALTADCKFASNIHSSSDPRIPSAAELATALQVAAGSSSIGRHDDRIASRSLPPMSLISIPLDAQLGGSAGFSGAQRDAAAISLTVDLTGAAPVDMYEANGGLMSSCHDTHVLPRPLSTLSMSDTDASVSECIGARSTDISGLREAMRENIDTPRSDPNMDIESVAGEAEAEPRLQDSVIGCAPASSDPCGEETLPTAQLEARSPYAAKRQRAHAAKEAALAAKAALKDARRSARAARDAVRTPSVTGSPRHVAPVGTSVMAVAASVRVPRSTPPLLPVSTAHPSEPRSPPSATNQRTPRRGSKTPPAGAHRVAGMPVASAAVAAAVPLQVVPAPVVPVTAQLPTSPPLLLPRSPGIAVPAASGVAAPSITRAQSGQSLRSPASPTPQAPLPGDFRLDATDGVGRSRVSSLPASPTPMATSVSPRVGESRVSPRNGNGGGASPVSAVVPLTTSTSPTSPKLAPLLSRHASVTPLATSIPLVTSQLQPPQQQQQPRRARPHALSTPSVVSASPGLQQPRSDMWIAAQWITTEAPIQRRWPALPGHGGGYGRDCESGNSTSSVCAPGASCSPALGPPLPIPRALGTGSAVTLHEVIAFSDGSVGVLSPQSVSSRQNDAVLLAAPRSEAAGGDSHAVTSSAAATAPHALLPLPQPPPSVVEPMYLPLYRPVGAAPEWRLQSGASAVSWLERPRGEESDRVAAAAVCRGRQLVLASAAPVAAAPSAHSMTPAPCGGAPGGGEAGRGQPSSSSAISPSPILSAPVIVSSSQPDVIAVAFARVVGVWEWTHSAISENGAAAPGDTAGNAGMRAGGTEAITSPHASASRQVLAGAAVESSATTLNSDNGSKKAQRRRRREKDEPPALHTSPAAAALHHAAAAGNSIEGVAEGGGLATPPRNLDASVTPRSILRVHSHVVTCVAMHRTQTPLPYGAVVVVRGDDEAALDGTRDVTVASGDAGGEVVLWRAADAFKIASLWLGGAGRRAGDREGVTVIALNERVIVAGGSEGTVTVWRRRYRPSEAAVVPPVATSGASRSLVVEVAPELIARERGAHSIVRCAIAPASAACALSAVFTGGGEGDVRMWPCPSAPSTAAAATAAAPASTATTTHSIPPLLTAFSSGFAGVSDASVTTLASTLAAVHLRTQGHAFATSGATALPIQTASKLFKGHGARITGLFADNVKLVSTSLDGSVKLWDLHEPHVGRPLTTVHLPGTEASSLAVTGTSILVGTVDGRAFLYSFDPRDTAAGLVPGGVGVGGFGSSSYAVGIGSGGGGGTGGSGSSRGSSGVNAAASSPSFATAVGGPGGAHASRSNSFVHGNSSGGSTRRELRDELRSELQLAREDGRDMTPLELQRAYDSMNGRS